MTRYLIDTNIVSDLIQFPQGVVTRTIAQVGVENVVTSIIVACELRYGAARRGSQRLTERVEGALGFIPVLPLDHDVDRTYAETRSDLEKRGLTIGANDLLIAAHALATDAILVTDNVREFARVDGLRIVNWLR
ncbi:type II toxin-antitoxin system VapC family toxin [Sphingomonas floccifaciens]|uniref:Ribonuclease VapC n=1 Tax=Sphingomonas floccifaciens TaxID=1844115 RepID=A0ABW4NJQ9_9SPHN